MADYAMGSPSSGYFGRQIIGPYLKTAIRMDLCRVRWQNLVLVHPIFSVCRLGRMVVLEAWRKILVEEETARWRENAYISEKLMVLLEELINQLPW